MAVESLAWALVASTISATPGVLGTLNETAPVNWPSSFALTVRWATSAPPLRTSIATAELGAHWRPVMVLAMVAPAGALVGLTLS